ncbi:hypothetical protein Q3G72_000930 [Acer saccharum]|nr:hypothetical protein Q3G72_000930 [Acer saccharum]
MFVFSAQQEAKVNEVMKEKPPDPFFNAKRARAQEDLDDNLLRKSSDSFKSKLLGHSKEACKEGVEEQIKVAEVPENGDEVSAAGKESFGPWMQVSYGKNGRNTAGGKNFGRKYGNVGNSGGFGAASRSNDVSKTVVMDKTDVAKNSAGKVAVGNSIRPRLGLYQGNRKIGGSRFEILSEDLEENVGTNNYNSRSPKHNKPVPNKILSDISNRGKISGGQSINHSKKVLEVNKSRGNKSFKEVYKEVGFGVSGKVHNKGSHSGKLVVNHQVGMEEELEDSDVLQALHQDMLNSEVVVKGTEESNMIAVGESILEDGLEQVDVPGATNFDEVAFKLKEAMEIAIG